MFSVHTLTLVFLMKSFVEGGLMTPRREPVLQYFNTYKNPTDSGETGSLLDRQFPEDIVFDLAGRMKLITRDEITEEYNTFMVNRDDRGIPYVWDPGTGHKYVVKHSRVRRGVQIYRVTLDKTGKPLVSDGASMTVNRIKLNNYGEVELVPIDNAVLEFGDQDQ